MFEARLPQSATLKKLLDSVKDLIAQTNFDCSNDGISLQVSPHRPTISALPPVSNASPYPV